MWIEIAWERPLSGKPPSHSLRGSVDWNLDFLLPLRLVLCHSLRGSVDWNKLIVCCLCCDWHLSLPAWECGLKLHRAKTVTLYHLSLPAWECGLKSSIDAPIAINVERHSLRGSVDWNRQTIQDSEESEYRHSLRGSVDWNLMIQIITHNLKQVTPCVGVWIEILSFNAGCPLSIRCHSLRGSVDWNLLLFAYLYIYFIVTPCVGVWIEIFKKRGVNVIYTGHSLRGSVDWN